MARITILGATGSLGTHLAEQAVAANHAKGAANGGAIRGGREADETADVPGPKSLAFRVEGRRPMQSAGHEHEVAWLLELAVNPGQLETVRALMDEMVASTRAEPGARGYVWFVAQDGGVVALYERYADSAAALAHLATFGETFAQRFLSLMTPTRVTVFGAPTDEARQALSDFNPTYLGYFGGFTAR